MGKGEGRHPSSGEIRSSTPATNEEGVRRAIASPSAHGLGPPSGRGRKRWDGGACGDEC